MSVKGLNRAGLRGLNSILIKPTAISRPIIRPRFRRDFTDDSEHRPDFDNSQTPIQITKSPDPSWQYGQGVCSDPSGTHDVHREIDPDAPSRSKADNYSLLISGITPRPIGFISTQSNDGNKKNLAPFSYFQVVDHDPPLFILGFGTRSGKMKDNFLNLKETGECVINTVSENMIEAVNSTSLDAPYGVSEWEISGLHEAPTTTVRPSRVQESVFAIEGKVVDIKEFTRFAKPGMTPNAVVFIQGTRFWVRGDATNDESNHIHLDKLRPLGQLGGMAYGRVTSIFDVPRKTWKSEKDGNSLLRDLEKATQT